MSNIKQKRLYKILMANNVEVVDELFELIEELEIIRGFDQHSKYHHLNVLDHSILAINLSPMNFDVRLSLLLHDIGKPLSYTVDDLGYYHYRGHAYKSYEVSKVILNKLEYEDDYIDYILDLILNHDVILPKNIEDLYKLGVEKTPKYVLDLLDVRIADILSHNEFHKGLNKEVTSNLEENIKVLRRRNY